MVGAAKQNNTGCRNGRQQASRQACRQVESAAAAAAVAHLSVLRDGECMSICAAHLVVSCRGRVEAGKRVRRGAAFGWAPLLLQAPSALPEGRCNSPAAWRRAMQAAEGRAAQAMVAGLWSR